MSESTRPADRFSPAEMAKLNSWVEYVLAQWDRALDTYSKSGLPPESNMLRKAIEHYEGAIAGLEYFSWIVNSRKPKSRKRPGRRDSGPS